MINYQDWFKNKPYHYIMDGLYCSPLEVVKAFLADTEFRKTLGQNKSERINKIFDKKVSSLDKTIVARDQGLLNDIFEHKKGKWSIKESARKPPKDCNIQHLIKHNKIGLRDIVLLKYNYFTLCAGLEGEVTAVYPRRSPNDYITYEVRFPIVDDESGKLITILYENIPLDYIIFKERYIRESKSYTTEGLENQPEHFKLGPIQAALVEEYKRDFGSY